MAIIKYIIADDHKVFRDGLRYTLNSDHKLKYLGEVQNGSELMDLLSTTKPDVILLDLKMPEVDGTTATEKIRNLYPSIKIIVLTMFDDENLIIHMLDLGVNGYLVKTAHPEEIKKAIHIVYDNDYYFNDTVSKAMLKTLVQKNKIQPKFQNTIDLSDREKEILKLICQEYTSAEIAAKVFLSQRTVEALRSSLLEKIGVKNIAGLVLYAVKNGLIV